MTTQEIKIAEVNPGVPRNDQEALRVVMASGRYPALVDRIFTGIRRITPQEETIAREIRRILPPRPPSPLTKSYKIP